MNSLQAVENEFRQFLQAYDNLSYESRVRALMAIFSKHFELNALPHLVTGTDISLIASIASHRFSTQRVPMYIGKRRIQQDELITVAMLEGVLNYLNGQNCLRKEVVIDYQDGKV